MDNTYAADAAAAIVGAPAAVSVPSVFILPPRPEPIRPADPFSARTDRNPGKAVNGVWC